MQRSSAITLPAIFLTLASASIAGESHLRDCYARWDEQRLTVGNGGFERAWVVSDAGLSPVSFLMKNPDAEWLADSSPDTRPAGEMDVISTVARRGAVGAEGLRLEVATKGKAPDRQVIWIFPGLSGVLAERMQGAKTSSLSEKGVATGIETEPGAQPAAKASAGEEMLNLRPRHLRLTETELRDQTDGHNELVHENEWLLAVNEGRIDIRGCVVSVENVLDGSGIAFLKLAPLPHARPDPQAIDFRVQPGARQLSSYFHGYPQAAVAYRHGAAGRIRAFHEIQRRVREYNPARDGMFLSNTWGDRSRDARINEAFLLKEVEAGAALGVDVVQIDDGWQKGRSANSSKGKGVFNGYWATDPEFWTPDPQRFPNGLETVVKAARGHGMKFGLWFGPDSSNDAANWQKDADHLLEMHRRHGIDYFKIDSMKTMNAVSLGRQRAMFDRMLDGSKGAMTFDLDVTAEIRPGYFGLPEIGPVFLENRYSDWGSYWPHLTLRNLWMLSHTVDPLRMRIEVLNPERSQAKYGDDPLAPARYRADTLFAIAMTASPLGWFETSNLSPQSVSLMKPLVTAWKQERARMHGGTITPIGSAPDGVSWTGFTSTYGQGGYVLLFRELNANPEYKLDLAWSHAPSSATVIGGRGNARLSGNTLNVTIPEKLDYLWVKLK